MTDDPFGSAAEYRAKGWVGTLPIPYGKKTPPPSGFTGESGAWPSTADVAAWSEQGRQNIALRLPPNVIALDVDDPRAFVTLIEAVGPLPPTWRAHSGGERIGHFYYRLPRGVVSTGWGAPCPGVDLLRFGHRYSVVAPSLHPSGTRYAWAQPDARGAGLASFIPGPGDLPELPAAWVAYLSGEGDQQTNVDSPRTVGDEDLLTIGTPIPAGTHQETLFRYACSLRTRGLPEEEAAALVRLRARQDCKPPWAGPDDPWDAVKHAYVKYEAGAPLDAPWPAYDAAVEALAEAPASSTAPVDASRFAFINWRELASKPVEPVTWYVEGLIAAGRGHVIYSATGVGKSLLSLEWAVQMVRGGLTVVYVDHENEPKRDVWDDRLVPMNVSPDELDRLHYLSFPEMGPLDRPEGGAELLAIALEVGADVVIVDTATRTVKGEENSNDTWTAWDRHTGVKLKKAGIAFLRIDHSGKDADKGQRGGSNKSTDVDIVWRLEKISDDEFTLTNEKERTRVPEKVIALRRERVPNLHHARVAPPSRLSREAAKMREIWVAMDEAGVEIDPTDDLGHPKGVRKLAAEVRDLAGAEGRHELLAAVAKARWAAVHNSFATRPEWAPSMSDQSALGA